MTWKELRNKLNSEIHDEEKIGFIDIMSSNSTVDDVVIIRFGDKVEVHD